MDRKVRILAALACVLCCLAAMPLAASAATVYDGTISTTYITIFRDIASKFPVDTDYVFFRSGQYEYILVAGDLIWDGSMFTGENVTQYILTTNSSYNSSYEYGTASLDTFSLATGSSLVYSNLGNFPDLYERSDYLETAGVFALAVFSASNLLRPVFIFCLRLKNGEGV